MTGRIPKRLVPDVPRLVLPVAARTTFVLVGPHYPENVGAAARAIKTAGIERLTLVKPGRLARPDHEMASKMAVKSWDVLDAAHICETLEEGIEGVDLVFTTTSRTGTRGAISPRRAAEVAVAEAARNRELAFVLGNEKTGLALSHLALGDLKVRIPMAAEQPSINLAQAVQILAYELFVTGLAAREQP